MAAKEEEKPKLEAKPPGTFPGAPFQSPYLYRGLYSPFYPMGTYPRPLFFGACPYHKPSAGQPFTTTYRCPYCIPVQQQQQQQQQQNQNININIGGGFVPSGYNTQYYQASLLGATVVIESHWTSC
jgi:hypothetical protein